MSGDHDLGIEELAAEIARWLARPDDYRDERLLAQACRDGLRTIALQRDAWALRRILARRTDASGVTLGSIEKSLKGLAEQLARLESIIGSLESTEAESLRARFSGNGSTLRQMIEHADHLYAEVRTARAEAGSLVKAADLPHRSRPTNLDAREVALMAVVAWWRKTDEIPGLWKNDKSQPPSTPFGRFAATWFEMFGLDQRSLHGACDWAIEHVIESLQ